MGLDWSLDSVLGCVPDLLAQDVGGGRGRCEGGTRLRAEALRAGCREGGKRLRAEGLRAGSQRAARAGESESRMPRAERREPRRARQR